MEASGNPQESLDKSEFEPSVLGPRMAFAENAMTNLSQLRSRLKSPRLKVETRRFGTVSQTMVAIVYLQGICKNTLVEEPPVG